ncbi:MAG TPA: DUF6602 domain-containing protein [Candidatus Sulfotelmatobacter sp.]|nr:DUF6602 domain-containing protein [Candidatus Sulfotelmatobacter sp.]
MKDREDERYSVSDLFMQAARRLKSDFDYVRGTNPHSATKGSEAEKVLREFLNKHLPQRFRAATGILIDINNALSKQTDIIIYDALSSPVYRFSEEAMILPVDTVASVIEVKSRLTSDELADAYKKIASVKALKKRPSSEMDRGATGSELKMSSTLGVIFAFTSDISLETVAEKMATLNLEVDSQLWPDMVIVLDVGTLNYAIQSPGGEIGGDLMPREENFAIAPFYVNLVLRKDGEFSLNRFFITLLSHLQFFPHRPSVPPFDIALAGTATECIGICAYQYDRDKKLLPANQSLELPAAIQIKSSDGQVTATLHWIHWPGGGTIMCEDKAPLGMFLLLAGFAKDEQIFRCAGRQYSSVLPVKRAEFLRWPLKLNPKMKGMTAEVVVYKEEHILDEGTSTPFVARLLAGMLDLGHRILLKDAAEAFSKIYPVRELLSLRRLHRALEGAQPIPEELLAANLQTAARVAATILEIARTLGVNASFLLYREPSYTKGLEAQRDPGLARYLKEHRDSWARRLVEHRDGSQAKRQELCQSMTRSDLHLIYNGVAKLSEELMIYSLQSKAQAGLWIREVERAERDPKFCCRFTTDLKRSWSLTFNPAEFDEL